MTQFDPAQQGTVIREAFSAAAELARPEWEAISDPRDGTIAPVVFGKDGAHVLPSGTFDAYREKPIARTGTAKLTTLESFMQHTLRFKTERSAIFARDAMDNARLLTVFDYHPAEEQADTPGEAANCWHRAEYAFPLSDEWKGWTASDKTPMAMADFAAFLEDRIVDVVADAKPEGAAAIDFIAKTGGNMASPTKLIELARGLQVYENSVLREARNLSSGTGELTFESQHTDADGKPLQVPGLFMICIPVFARAPEAWQILARLRYRKTPGGVVFWYELWRADLVFETAFSDACTKVAEATALPLFMGQPET